MYTLEFKNKEHFKKTIPALNDYLHQEQKLAKLFLLEKGISHQKAGSMFIVDIGSLSEENKKELNEWMDANPDNINKFIFDLGINITE